MRLTCGRPIILRDCLWEIELLEISLHENNLQVRKNKRN